MRQLSTLGLLWNLGVACAVGGAPGLTHIDHEEEDLDSGTRGWLECSDARPTALVASPDGNRLFVALSGQNAICVVDGECGTVALGICLPTSPSGLALSPDGNCLYVTCEASESALCVIDVRAWRIIKQIAVGHTAMAPVPHPDGKTVYVCNRFNNDVSVVDLESGREARRIPVQREPVAAALTPNGRFLIVANHLPAGLANDLHSGAMVSVIDTAAGRVVKNVPLSLGANLLRGVAISPDGRFAAVTHIRALFWLTTSDTRLGSINSNALSVIDLERFRVIGTLLLDQACRGAANPWAVGWTPDGRTLVVSHAGTHELSLIDAPATFDRWNFPSPSLGVYAQFGSRIPEPPKHPVRVRKRVPLPGNGPRALAITGSHAYGANYFSGDIVRVDLLKTDAGAEVIAAWPQHQASPAEKGEMLFNDARLCSEGWQSCASCHDTDARSDALNWDLLNDGPGNPKNTKSLVWAHQTAPAMALGVRANAETAVRAGLKHILFSPPTDETADAIDTYLKSLTAVRSPHLVNGQTSPAAVRGQTLFESGRTGCASCHPSPLFTDLAAYDVGTERVYRMWGPAGADEEGTRFDTPTLEELWRSAPYLHDGSALTLRDVLTSHNRNDRHGHTTHLTPAELDDLVAYLLTL
ncbi:MAG: cytochrome c peroxidase [Verrucomicrobiia bacterium]